MVRKKSNFQRMFIELSDDLKGRLVYKWGDQQLRRDARVNVDADHVAVLVDRGSIVQVMGPGAHTIGAGPHVAVGWLVDKFTEESFHDMELFFVSTVERVGLPFGGSIDSVQAENYIVGLKAYGTYAFRVVDPVKLLTVLIGTGDLSDKGDALVVGWATQQVLAAVREETPRALKNHNSVFGLGAIQDEIESAAGRKVNVAMSAYGVEMTKFGELVVSVDEKDLTVLKQLAERRQLVEMAGSYDSYARSEALLAFGEKGGFGASGDGDGGSGGMLGGGMNLLFLASLLGGKPLMGVPVVGGVAGSVANGNGEGSSQVQPREFSGDVPGVCRQCQNLVAGSHAFCPSCGKSQLCVKCEGRLTAGRFCPSCGADNE